MKQGLFFLLLALTTGVQAQLTARPDCGAIVVDVYKGWINEAKPNADPEQIKAKLPCFTRFDKEGNESACGGGVYFEDKDLKFYTQRDYAVIGEKFKGKLSVPLLGARADDLFGWLGNPKLKDANWEAYQMAYGILVVYFNDKKLVNKIIISTKPAEELDLCKD